MHPYRQHRPLKTDWNSVDETPASPQVARSGSMSSTSRSPQPIFSTPHSNQGRSSHGPMDPLPLQQPTDRPTADVQHENLLLTFSLLSPDQKDAVLERFNRSLAEVTQPGPHTNSSYGFPKSNASSEPVRHIHARPGSMPEIGTGLDDALPYANDTFDNGNYQYMPGYNDDSFDHMDMTQPLRHPSIASTNHYIQSANLNNLPAPSLFGSVLSRRSQSEVSGPSFPPQDETPQPAPLGAHDPHLSFMSTSSSASSRKYSLAASSVLMSPISTRTSMSSFSDPSPRQSRVARVHPSLSTAMSSTQVEQPYKCKYAPACTSQFARRAECSRHETAHCQFNKQKSKHPCLVCVYTCTNECPPGCDGGIHTVYDAVRKDKMRDHWRKKHGLGPQDISEFLKGAFASAEVDAGDFEQAGEAPGAWMQNDMTGENEGDRNTFESNLFDWE